MARSPLAAAIAHGMGRFAFSASSWYFFFPVFCHVSCRLPVIFCPNCVGWLTTPPAASCGMACAGASPLVDCATRAWATWLQILAIASVTCAVMGFAANPSNADFASSAGADRRARHTAARRSFSRLCGRPFAPAQQGCSLKYLVSWATGDLAIRQSGAFLLIPATVSPGEPNQCRLLKYSR